MTKDDVAIPLWRSPILIAALAGFGLLFAAGVATGVVAGTLERGAIKPIAAVFLAGAIALIAVSGIALRRALPAIYQEASPRVRKSRRLITLSAVIGAALGILLTLGSLVGGTERPEMFSNAPIAPWIALSMLAVWLLAVPPLTWQWHRSIDEHEASAYRDGTLTGMYAYCAIAPTWWLGWRGGFLPEPQEMITFLVVILVWGLVWLVRRHG